jgi:hypothetical protein
MHFSDAIKIKIDKENKKVRMSVKVSETTVITHEFSLNEFKVMMDQFNAELQG